MTRPHIPGRVTIGIPTRNRADYVMRALRSVLAQTYADVEAVVSDNASTDNTAARIEEIVDPRVVFLKQKTNIGMVGNFNACLQAATGEFFLMLSDDDLLVPEAVEELSRPLRIAYHGTQPERIGLAWCPCKILNPFGDALWITEGGPAVETPVSLITSLFNGRRGPRFCSVMVRTADALSVGGYNEARHGYLCDTGNWTRIALRYDRTTCIPRPLSGYTIHGASETSGQQCRDWQTCGENIFVDLLEALPREDRPSAETAIRKASRNHIANVTVTVLIQTVGRPGWVTEIFREAFRSRRYFFTPFVARRILRDGWKILRLREKQRQRIEPCPHG